MKRVLVCPSPFLVKRKEYIYIFKVKHNYARNNKCTVPFSGSKSMKKGTVTAVKCEARVVIKEEVDLGPSQPPDEGEDEEDDSGDVRWDIEMESRISLDLNLFVCMACSGSKYSSKQKLNVITHIRAKHLADFSGFVCELCPQVFNSKKRFERHMKICHNVLTVSTDNIKTEDITE